MKKNLLVLLVCLSWAYPGFVQTPGDYQFQFEFDNYLHEWVQGPDDTWFGLGTTQAVALTTKPFVIKWDAENDLILWKRAVSLPNNEILLSASLLPTSDGGVYVGATIEACDYPVQEALARLNAQGNVLWTVQTPEDFRFNNRVWLLPGSDDKVLFQTEKNQFVYTPDGNLVDINNTAFGWTGLVRNNAGGYLAYGNQAIGSFSPFFVLPFPDNIRHVVQSPAGEWLVLGAEKLYRLDPALNILIEKTISGMQSWSKVFWADDACWLTGIDGSSASVLHKIDPLTLETLKTHVFDKQYRVLSLVYEPGDTVLWLSGDCNFGRNQTVFLKSVPKDNPVIEPTKSAALTGLRLEQVPVLTAYPFPCSFLGGPAFGIAFGRVFATVTNTGNVPVSRFWINGRFNSCWNTCYYQTQFAKHVEIPLAPGESVEVLLTDAFQVSGALNDLSDTTYNLCFWTALPDDALDALPDDDRYCQSFSLIVANEEPASRANTVRVAPNPAIDRTTFSLDAADTSYRLVLTNAAGHVVRQEEFVGPTWTLERGALPAGLYFYQVTSRHGGVGVGRVVLGH